MVLHAEDNEMSRSSKPNRTRRLEMIWARRLKLLTKFGVAALALGALATSGKAQNAYQGKFRLPVETHWGSTTLPPGDYTFTLPSNSAPYRLYIQGQRVSAIIQANTAEQGVVSERPQLNLVDIADVYTVQTFEAPELGVTFTYWRPKQKHAEHKEARQKTVPQTAPASQVSENKTSIAVHTAGR
jgi:hypothetical protein